MRKNKFGSVGAAQMARMNGACTVMSRNTQKKLSKMKANHCITSSGKTESPKDRRETIARG